MSKKNTNCDLTGHNPGRESLSADELRRDCEMYGPEENSAYEPQNLTDKEKAHAGGDDTATNWPHKDAFDIGGQLTKAEAENAAFDQHRTEATAANTFGKKPRDLESEVGMPGKYEDAPAGQRNERDPEHSKR
jgi:hypothetical protein